MSYFNENAYVERLHNRFPPFLEAVATLDPGDSRSIGLTPEGRTVRWMRGAQKVVTAVFSNLAGLAGLFLGALYGALRAAFGYDNVEAIKGHAATSALYGWMTGVAAGTVAGSLASVVVVPWAGAANLLEYARARYAAANPPPEQSMIELMPLR